MDAARRAREWRQAGGVRGLRSRVLGWDHEGARLANTAARSDDRLAWLAGAAARRLAGAEVLLMGLLAWRGRRRSALRMLASVAVVYVTVEALARGCPRLRPFARVAGVRPLAWHHPQRSFPSRHTASAMAMASIGRRADPRLGNAMLLVALAIGSARVAAGLHYPSDVLVGGAIGTFIGRVLRGG